MKKVVLYTDKRLADDFGKRTEDVDVRHVNTMAAFIEEVVKEHDAFCGAIQADPKEPSLLDVAVSVKKSFPFLHVCYICEQEPPSKPEEVGVVCCDGGPEALSEEMGRYFYHLAPSERRQFNRYNWPLRGFIKTKGGWHPLNVYSLSAGGAFLEHEGTLPKPGTKADIVIVFQNCKLRTTCEVLSPRQASSNLPFGFGIRFLGLAEESQEVLNSIVNDALVKAILEDPDEKSVPTIGEESLTFQFELT